MGREWEKRAGKRRTGSTKHSEGDRKHQRAGFGAKKGILGTNGFGLGEPCSAELQDGSLHLRAAPPSWQPNPPFIAAKGKFGVKKGSFGATALQK